MVRTYTSPPASPADRGEQFGRDHAERVTATLDRYRGLFTELAGEPVDLHAVGEEALRAIGDFSPDAAAEICALAGGAGLRTWEVAALNARTEIIARLGATVPAECSTVVWLPPDGCDPVTLQTWDWHDVFADAWLAWTIEHPDGHIVHTVTEYGILGKVGVSTRGVGVHMNILTHSTDGGAIGVPVHVLARGVLDRAAHAGAAVAMLGASRTSASTVLTVTGAGDGGTTAVCAELAPEGPRFVLPSERGLLLHTNHFLDPNLAGGDRAPVWGPDSYLRLDVLRRALHDRVPHDREQLRAILADHSGGAGSICCHPDADAPLGERWATLATVSLDVAGGELWVRAGAPCDEAAGWHVCRAPAPTPTPA
jgi:isopenicillin-N N-acyltransferase-like protein